MPVFIKLILTALCSGVMLGIFCTVFEYVIDTYGRVKGETILLILSIFIMLLFIITLGCVCGAILSLLLFLWL